MPESKPPEYQIATVARLTGLNEQNIRTWERRYSIVVPERTPTGRRLYSESDIELLILLRQLVERGHSIGSLKGKSQSELEDLLRRDVEAPEKPGQPETRRPVPLRVLVVGRQLHTFLQQEAEQLPEMDIVEVLDSLKVAVSEPLLPAFDLLLVDQPSLFPQDVEKVSQFAKRNRARFTVVVYRFGQRDVLSALEAAGGMAAMQGPINGSELTLVIESGFRSLAVAPPPGDEPETDLGLDEDELPVPKRRFTDSELNRLWKLSPEVKCECPQHLANLLISLTAFEDYSLECENRNEEDAKLHAYLHHTTALARAAFERALERVIQADAIDI